MLPRSRYAVLALSSVTLVAITLQAAAHPRARATTGGTGIIAVPGNQSAQQMDSINNLWQIEFNLNHEIMLVSTKGESPVHAKFDNMRYFVRPLGDMFVTRAGVFGNYWETIGDPNEGPQEWKSTGRPRFPQGTPKLLVGRKVETCDPLLDVWTEGSKNTAGKANTFVISNNFEWQTMWRRPPGAGQMRTAAPVYTPTEQEVPYDYTKLVNSGTEDLPLNPGGGAAPAFDRAAMQRAARSMGVTIPQDLLNAVDPGNAAPYRKIRRSITYRIIRKHMELVLLPQCLPGQSPGDRKSPVCVIDLIGSPPLIACPQCDKLTNNLAEDRTRNPNTGRLIRNHFIHANIEMRLKIDGDDATYYTEDGKYFETVRLMRDWVVPLHADNDRGGPYLSQPNGWKPDYPRTSGPNWKDMPGILGIATDINPSAWKKREKLVKEFLVAVKGFPEFGFIYYAITIDVKENGYRVRQTPATRITADEWCRIKSTPLPHRDFVKRGYDSGWQPGPARQRP